jgi:Mn2+/Fe2+ NRAMP family transporter
MGVIVTITVGLIIWIVLWAQGIKSFDAFLIPITLAVVATIVRLIAPMLPGNRDE